MKINNDMKIKAVCDIITQYCPIPIHHNFDNALKNDYRHSLWATQYSAYYLSINDLIVISPFSGIEKYTPRYLAVLLHELAHATGHTSRLNRHGINDLNRSSKDINIEELIAERASQMLMTYFSLNETCVKHNGKTNKYILDYLSQVELTQEECECIEIEAHMAMRFILDQWIYSENKAKVLNNYADKLL